MLNSSDQHVFLGMTAMIRSEAMRRLLQVIERMARVDASVLITGESGVGKELAARAVHQYSNRSGQPWVDVSCGALPEHLVESELFGHEKGAFSSAESAKPGLFELADKGTLFLDEIGELDPRIQVKLLRVLDGVAYYRLGGTHKIVADVRVVAATNRDLGEMVREGTFRADLFHRLSQLQLNVPPLRERFADVAPLAEFFLQQFRSGACFGDDALAVLHGYNWPGNVRELRNVVIKTAVMASENTIRAGDLPPQLTTNSIASLTSLAQSVTAGVANEEVDWSLDSMERKMVLRVLEETGWRHQRAADMLGISRRTLHRKLKTYEAEGLCPQCLPVECQ